MYVEQCMALSQSPLCCTLESNFFLWYARFEKKFLWYARFEKLGA
jgi:hypothetical protein